ncbi:hypothetical protein [Burkholderia pseudomallei]|uniref:hypothetical protein n=1 Tax=Burkholderia pseudomallei TaxID=28450 RepID=UPI000531120B|nr:hypothetical protein [Burkholderia pseudomallei]KGS89802.1 hypothetical protein X947_6103 [Burkholderia pseudomallei MSHR7334]
MTDDEAKARIDVLHDEAATILAEQGLSPVQAYCLILEWVTVRHEPTLQLLADAAAYDQWFRDEVQESLDDPRESVSDEDVRASCAKQRAELLARIKNGNE